MFKNEAGGKQIVEFVSFRDNFDLKKMHVGSEDKICKVMSKNVTKRVFYSMIIESLFSRKEQHRKMNVVRSHCHEIYTEEINKIALSSDDGKPVIMADGILTLAYGFTNLKKNYN